MPGRGVRAHEERPWSPGEGESRCGITGNIKEGGVGRRRREGFSGNAKGEAEFCRGQCQGAEGKSRMEEFREMERDTKTRKKKTHNKAVEGGTNTGKGGKKKRNCRKGETPFQVKGFA